MAYMFSGIAEITVDDKNRFRFPAKFKDAYTTVDDAGHVLFEDIFIFRDPDSKYLTIFPKKTGENVLKSLRSKITLRDNSLTPVIEYYCSRMDPSKVDSQGRFVISQKQAGNIKLGTEFVMVGMCDKIALWNKADFEKHNAELEANLGKMIESNAEISEMLNNIFISTDE